MARAHIASPSHDIEQSLLAEFLVTLVDRFGDAIGVDGEQIAWEQLHVLSAAGPVAEQTHDGCRGRQSLHRSISLHDETRKMAAVRVSQSARAIVELRVEQRGVGVIGGVLVE